MCFIDALIDSLKSAHICLYNPILLCMSYKIFNIGLAHSEVIWRPLDKILFKWFLC